MSPQNNEYEGRHRDESEDARELHGVREYRFKWAGQEYRPRHSAARRESVGNPFGGGRR